MNCVYTHGWPSTKHDAYRIQAAATAEVLLHGNAVEPTLIAAVDTDYGVDGEYLYAAAIVLSFPAFDEVERAYARIRVTFPYIPGLFFFREGPAITEALSKLTSEPDAIILSGHGIAHPKRCGLASHIGLAFDRPAIGCARKLLAGQHRPVGETKGNSQPITLEGKEVGLAYRSKDKVKPIFISPGHKCDLGYARDIIVRSLRGFRLPEPLRVAHLLANRYRQRSEKSTLVSTDTRQLSNRPSTEPDKVMYKDQ